jgi:purine-binding chemotaxis protein CheW
MRECDEIDGGPEQGLATCMPQAAEEQRILQQRAQSLAREEGAAAAQEERELYVRLRLGASERYGIPSRYVQEVMPCTQMARVPGVPESIAGVVNRRGELLTVLDLGSLFGISCDDRSEEARVIVVATPDMTLGVLVDDVEGFSEYHVSGLSPPLPSAGVRNLEHVLGIHGGSVAVLNMDAIVSDPTLIVNQSAG